MGKRPVLVGSFAGLVLGFFLCAVEAQAQTLAQVIEGAKKERTVSAKLKSTLTPKSMGRLEKEILGKYGVTLEIKYTPSDQAKDIAEATMEQKAGAPPTYDVRGVMSSHITGGIKAGVLEKVNWEALLAEEAPRKAILGLPPQDPRFYGYGLSYFTGRIGVMYNPEKVSAREVPKTLRGLADPKWKGKVGIFNYQNSWARLAFVGGKEKVLSDLRAILKNEAIQGRYIDLYNRYLLGEVSLTLTSTAYLKAAWDKGMPAAWQGLEPIDVQHFSLVLIKGARHLNAGKLLVAYLASPEGAKFMLEEGSAGNYLYPGNFEYDVHQQELKQGLRHVSSEESHIVEFELSEEFPKWEKEMKVILQGGR